MKIIRIVRKILRQIASAKAMIRFRKYSTIGRSVHIASEVSIGRGCVIGNGVTLASGVELGDNVQIGSRAYLERITIGDNSVFDGRALITGYGQGRIQIGHDSYIGPDTALDFSDNLRIGSYVHIAGLSTGLWTHSSARMCLNGIPLADKSLPNRPIAPITIEDNVYIGGNCTIYPGVNIGHHSIVAPNSAVTKDVPPFTMVGGVPARIIKTTRDIIQGI